MKFMILDEFSNIKSTNVDLVNKKLTLVAKFPKKVKSMQKNVFFKKSGKFPKKSKKKSKKINFSRKMKKVEKSHSKNRSPMNFSEKII